jgi:hypothetical protein
MSDTKSDKELQMLLESISAKINSSAVLNGGFDKMLVIVENIKEKQAETSKKVDEIHRGLYEPDSGLYARVKSVESGIQHMAEEFKFHADTDEKNMAGIRVSLDKLVDKDKDLEKKVEPTVKLKKIAGDDLEKLESVIKVKSTAGEWFSKVVWALILAVLGGAGKALWDVANHK